MTNDKSCGQAAPPHLSFIIGHLSLIISNSRRVCESWSPALRAPGTQDLACREFAVTVHRNWVLREFTRGAGGSILGEPEGKVGPHEDAFRTISGRRRFLGWAATLIIPAGLLAPLCASAPRERLVAVGDIHGDFTAFVEILE